MCSETIHSRIHIMYNLLRDSLKTRDVSLARHILCLAISEGLDIITFWGDHLIRLFDACGTLEEAEKCFCRLINPSTFSWNAIISAHENFGMPKVAMDLFQKMQRDGVLSDVVTYLCTLKLCVELNELDQGRLIHEEIISRGIETDVNIGSGLVNFYAKCQALDEASLLFDSQPNRNVVTWGAIIAGYISNDYSLSALALFESMQDQSIKPSEYTLSCVLKACGKIQAMKEGLLLHHEIVKFSYEFDVISASSLVGMYLDCGFFPEAYKIFEGLPKKDIVSWGIIISGAVTHGYAVHALELYVKLQETNLKPNTVIFLSILQSCGCRQDCETGMAAHHNIMERFSELSLEVGNTLIDMYVKCGHLDEGFRVFESLTEKDVISCGALIAGYLQFEFPDIVLDLFHKMFFINIQPNEVILLHVFKACSLTGTLCQGKMIHHLAVNHGMESRSTIGTALVDMYVQFADLKDSRAVFDTMSEVDEVAYGVMLGGYVTLGYASEALEFYDGIQFHAPNHSKVLFLLILSACSSIGKIPEGRKIHMQIVRDSLESDISIGTAVSYMYLKCGSLWEAFNVFDSLTNKDVVSYGTMIEGFVLQGHSLIALELFIEMQAKHIEPNKAILLSILKACSRDKALELGMMVHNLVFECILESGAELGSAIVDMYAKFGYLEEACKVFDNLECKDIVSWSVLIAGCFQEGYDLAAVNLFKKMQENGIQPDISLILLILKVCKNIEATEYSRVIHILVVKVGLESDTAIRKNLYNTYACFGWVEEACSLFDSFTSDFVKDEVINLQNVKCSAEILTTEKKADFHANETTMVLSEFSHSGRLKEGCASFSLISNQSLVPTLQQYGCMVDLLSRVGQVEEADCLINTMPVLPDNATRVTLIASCKQHCALEFGKSALLMDKYGIKDTRRRVVA